MVSRHRGLTASLGVFPAILDKFKAHEGSLQQIFDLAVHLIAFSGALSIVLLNLTGYFVGKELQGNINQDGTKMLALQLTAKLHELLMISSLAKILWFYSLRLVMSEHGAPIATLPAAGMVASISYLWSAEFIASCIASFARKAPFLTAALLWTLLGAFLGPSSATAMAPSTDEFLAAQVVLPLTMSPVKMWPMLLDSTLQSTSTCTGSTSACNHAGTWASLAANCFSYWGDDMLGGLKGTTEVTNIPGSQSNRQMRYRFRGFSLFQPEYTSATTQTVWAADHANYLRFLWTGDHNGRCARRENHYCSYQDLKFSIQTSQPNVAVSCNQIETDKTLTFPTMVRDQGRPSAAYSASQGQRNNSSQRSQLTWITLDGESFSQTSAGIIIDLPTISSTSTTVSLACSVDAQWSNTTIATTFLGAPLLVDGFDPYFFAPTLYGSTYVGRRVKISPDWAQFVNTVISTTSNQTAFDFLYSTGKIPQDSATAIPKVEAVLSVLIAESMAWISSNASIALGSYQYDTVNWDTIVKINAPLSTSSFRFRATVVGFGFGIRTANSLVIGRVLSILTLLVYCVIVVVYLFLRIVRPKEKGGYQGAMLNLLVLALRSSSINQNASSEATKDVLKRNVRIMDSAGGNKILVDGDGSSRRYHPLNSNQSLENIRMLP